MKVYKFGGGVLKDAKSIGGLVNVLEKTGSNNVFIVVSAIGKTTNALEKTVKNYVQGKDFETSLCEINQNHQQILNGLFQVKHPVFSTIAALFADLRAFFQTNRSNDYNFIYDQVVCYGELLSTHIISAYLKDKNIENSWLDVRKYIKTDHHYREARVDWKATANRVNSLAPAKCYITQGFVGGDKKGYSTTLGREGSDFSAAVFAYCINAKSVTVFKDVQGILNADPRYFQNTILLAHISYQEALELAYHGASVIHPKTLKPLLDKQIPLYVKSFQSPLSAGTSIKQGEVIRPKIPCFIVKKNQILLSITSRDLSLINEKNISDVFTSAAVCKIKVSLVQICAVNLSLCIGDKYDNVNRLIKKLDIDYSVNQVKKVDLYTIRHYDDLSLQRITTQYKVILLQKTKNTAQIVSLSL